MKLKNLNAIVTGSTSGIGNAIANVLASEGANIVMNGFGDKDDIETKRISIEKEHNVKCIYSGADLTDVDQINEMIELTTKTFGTIDILINNAGVQFVAPIEEFPAKRWDLIMAVNLSAAFHTMSGIVPKMKKNNFGRIINIASAHGLVASEGKAGYVAAKHGLVGLTKVVALETAEYDITCNSICPGWVDTPLVRKQIEDRANNNGTSVEIETKKLIGEKQPNKRFATPEAIGRLAVYLADPENKFTTGAPNVMDGGWTSW